MTGTYKRMVITNTKQSARQPDKTFKKRGDEERGR